MAKALLLFLLLVLVTMNATMDHISAHQAAPAPKKLTKFRVYWHDIVSGAHPSGADVTHAVNTSSTFFGQMRVIDNPLTKGPENTSELVGRAQGFYLSTSQESLAALMVMNFVFLRGGYNGSTITVIGRNEVFMKVREMPVVGGSGVFRGAQGYVQLRTTKVDNTGDAVVQYNLHVIHSSSY